MQHSKAIEELEREIQVEIDKHKWLKSELANKDIGGKAIDEWMSVHFPNWLEWKKQQITSQLMNTN